MNRKSVERLRMQRYVQREIEIYFRAQAEVSTLSWPFMSQTMSDSPLLYGCGLVQ